MKTLLPKTAFPAIFLLVSFVYAQDFPAAELQKPGKIAEQYLSLLRGEIADSKEAELTTEEFRAQMSLGFARQIWNVTSNSGGKFESLGPVTSYPYLSDGYKSFAEVILETRKLVMVVLHNSSGLVSGLYFDSPEPASSPPPDYANENSFAEKELIIRIPGWPLPATLTMPSGPGLFPAVVLIHGLGPLDRDESTGPNKVFRDLAQGLASMGIAVLRYEKRTSYYSVSMANYADSITVRDETVDDAVFAVRMMKGIQGIDPARIFVAGHGLGAICAPLIAKEAKNTAGIVMLSGTSRPPEDLVLDHFRYLAMLDDTITKEEKTEMYFLKGKVDMVKSPILSFDTPREELPLDLTGSFWISLRECEVTKTVTELKKPVLILQGFRDYQVTKTDFDSLKNELGENDFVTFVSFDDADHLFRKGTEKSTPESYKKPGNVSEDVVKAIANWVKK